MIIEMAMLMVLEVQEARMECMPEAIMEWIQAIQHHLATVGDRQCMVAAGRRLSVQRHTGRVDGNETTRGIAN